MPPYRIEIVKRAEKEFARLPAKIRSKIAEALGVLAQNPRSELLKVKKLKGQQDVFRLRIGDYRVLYEILDERLVVVVIKIGHRSEVYRRGIEVSSAATNPFDEYADPALEQARKETLEWQEKTGIKLIEVRDPDGATTFDEEGSRVREYNVSGLHALIEKIMAKAVSDPEFTTSPEKALERAAQAVVGEIRSQSEKPKKEI